MSTLSCFQRGFRIGSSTKLDDRVYALEQIKTLPLNFLLLELYPNLYPVHALDDKVSILSYYSRKKDFRLTKLHALGFLRTFFRASIFRSGDSLLR